MDAHTAPPANTAPLDRSQEEGGCAAPRPECEGQLELILCDVCGALQTSSEQLIACIMQGHDRPRQGA